MRRRAAGSRVTATRRPSDRSRRVRRMSKPLKEVFVPHLNRTVKFGRKRSRPRMSVKLSNYLLASLPDPVVAFTDARFRQRQRILLAPAGSLVRGYCAAAAAAAAGQGLTRCCNALPRGDRC